VRARLAERAEDWAYSSAAAHATGAPDPLAEADWLGELTAGWVCSWAEHLRNPDDAELGKRLRRHEGTGRPLGDRPFLTRLSAMLGRELVPKKPGPTPKRKTEKGS